MGADVGAKSNGGETPLHLASYNGRVGAMEALLARGADPDAGDNGGRTTPPDRAGAIEPPGDDDNDRGDDGGE